jgi:hypothetical protein
MHQTTVAKLEAGKRPLRVAEAVALAQVFGLPLLAMFYMPVDGEHHSMEYMRERLKILDRTILERENVTMGTIESFVKLQAHYAAEREIVADNMRQATAAAEREAMGGEDAEH